MRSPVAALSGLLALVACNAASDARTAAPGAQVPATGSVAAVVGCYQLSDSAGQPLDVDSVFWAGPVRLDTTRTPKLRDLQAEGFNRDAFSVQPLGHVPPTAILDTALVTPLWYLQAPDTVRIVLDATDVKRMVALRPSAGGLAGRLWTWEHVEDSRPPDPQRAVRARRITCPSGRPSAA